MFAAAYIVLGSAVLTAALGGVKVLEVDSILGSDGLFEGKTVAVGSFDTMSTSINKFNKIVSDPGTLNFAYNKYATQYSKDVEESRKEVFKSTLLSVFQHNTRARSGSETFTMGVNQFSDLTLDEVKAKYTGAALPNSTHIIDNQTPNLLFHNARLEINAAAPEARDWRVDGMVTSPKDQGQCGSCTLFAVTGALESAMAINKKKKNLDLSEQELLDCPQGSGVGRCGGNWPEDIYEYQKNSGQTSESSYKYEGKEGKCRASGKTKVAKVGAYYRATQGDENAMKDYIGKYGPCSIVITINDDFKNYKSGVMSTPCEGSNFDHSVLAVGYGSDSQLGDYWIVKNSWGTAYWGDKGYIKMARNADNICRISDYVILPQP